MFGRNAISTQSATAIPDPNMQKPQIILVHAFAPHYVSPDFGQEDRRGIIQVQCVFVCVCDCTYVLVTWAA